MDKKLQALLRDRHRRRAFPRIREVVGRLLHDERRGDPLHREQSIRGEQAREGKAGASRRGVSEPEEHPEPHPGLCLEGRQHHPASAGPLMDHQGLSIRRRDQEARTGHRLHHPRGHRAPGNLRRGKRRKEGAQGDHPQLRNDRIPPARPLRDGDRGGCGQGRHHYTLRGKDPGRYRGPRRRAGRGGGFQHRGAGLRVQRPDLPELPEPLGEGLFIGVLGGDDALAQPPEGAALHDLGHEPDAAPPRRGGSPGPCQPQTRIAGQRLRGPGEVFFVLYRGVSQLLPRQPGRTAGEALPRDLRP